MKREKELVGRNFVKKSFVLSNNMFKISSKRKYTFESLYQK